jgi:hypothetical protein
MLSKRIALHLNLDLKKEKIATNMFYISNSHHLPNPLKTCEGGG